jgi:hypothetical protein
MRINYDTDGDILSAGYGLGWSGIEYTDPLPADFMDTFALGKYKVTLVLADEQPQPSEDPITGETVTPDPVYVFGGIYEVPGWVPPPAPENDLLGNPEE